MANFYTGEIKNSTFRDQTAEIRNIEIASVPDRVDFERIEGELAEIKSNLASGSIDFQVIER